MTKLVFKKRYSSEASTLPPASAKPDRGLRPPAFFVFIAGPMIESLKSVVTPQSRYSAYLAFGQSGCLWIKIKALMTNR